MPGSTPSPTMYSNVVDEVVTQQYIRGEWNNTLRIRYWWKAMNDAKSVAMDEGGGKFIEWKARLGEWTASVAYRGDLAQRTFVRKNLRTTYTTGWSFFEVTPMLSERDLQFLNTPQNITNFQNQFLTEVGQDAIKNINQRCLAENTTGATKYTVTTTATSDYPLNSFINLFDPGSGTVQNYVPDTNTTSGNIAATDKEALPNGTYCGVSTNPVTGVVGVDGQVRGSAAPVLINHTSSQFGGTTWLANALKVMDYAQVRLTRAPGPENRIGLILQHRTRFLDTKAAIRAASNQQVVFLDNGEGRNPNLGLFGDGMIPYNGLWVTYDEDMGPTDLMFYLNLKQLKFRIFPQPSLAGITDGPIKGNPEPFAVRQGWDIDAGAWKVVVSMCAQLTADPYFQGASYAFA